MSPSLSLGTNRNYVNLRILVVGLKGVGVETAKNIILGRPKAVTVWDPEQAQIQDLGTNFYLTEEDVGKHYDSDDEAAASGSCLPLSFSRSVSKDPPASAGKSRAEACVSKLAELNPAVEVEACSGELTEEFIKTFGAVIVCSTIKKSEAIRINNICRSNIVGGRVSTLNLVSLNLVSLWSIESGSLSCFSFSLCTFL